MTHLPAHLERLVDQLPTLADGQDPAPYPDQVMVDRDGQDDLDELGAPGDAPHTSREAVTLGFAWIASALYVGVGYCLKTIRSLFGVMPLYPDAETAWEETDHKHRTSNPDAIPWGVPIWWTNGGYGHVALSLGDGRCLTTDYVRTGQLGVAKIAPLAAWCGGRLAGWSNDINGVVVWRENPPPAPEPWGSLEDRERMVKNALERAIARNAPERRIKGLRKWLKQLQARRVAQARK